MFSRVFAITTGNTIKGQGDFQTGRVHTLKSVRRLSLQCVTFIFVPHQLVIKGNDRADSLANTVSVEDAGSMDRADLLNAIRETSRNKFSGGQDRLAQYNNCVSW